MSVEWETPPEVFDPLNDLYHFDLDVCASKKNAKCAKYYTKEDDALTKDWFGVCWMNPPYGREMWRWILKAKEESRKHRSIVVGLIPAYTYAPWFHDYILGHASIKYLRSRPRFVGAKFHFRTGLMIVTWGM